MKLTFKIKREANFVFAYLTDMQKFVSIHPVISQIDQTGANEYLVHETLKLGFIPVSFTYPVTIEKSQVDKAVVMRATVMKMTKIEMTFVLKAENGVTTIEETIEFKSLLPIKPIMQAIFKKQHAQLFKNLEALKGF